MNSKSIIIIVQSAYELNHNNISFVENKLAELSLSNSLMF